VEKKTVSIFLESSSGAVSCIRAYVEEENDKAIKIRPHNGVHILWIPKSALTKIDQGYTLAPWFVQTGYEAWFIARYRKESFLTA